MRKNDRVDLHGIVHVVREGSRWDDGRGWVYGGVFLCGYGYRSGFKPDITKKKPATCLWCLTNRSRL